MTGVHTPLVTDFGVEIAVCKEMHWSYEDLYTAPARMVDEILTRLSAEREWTNKRNKRDADKGR